jgi:hypothetical protein
MTDIQRAHLKGYTYPELNVGFELEFFYVFKRKDLITRLSPSAGETSTITPTLAQNYVRSILMHDKIERSEKTAVDQISSLFDEILVAGHRPFTNYSHWQLTEDSSLSVTRRHLAAELNVQLSEVKNYHWAGMELISPPVSLLYLC